MAVVNKMPVTITIGRQFEMDWLIEALEEWELQHGIDTHQNRFIAQLKDDLKR